MNVLIVNNNQSKRFVAEEALLLLQEVNSLQWELSFNQMQMKKSVQSLEQKYQR